MSPHNCDENSPVKEEALLDINSLFNGLRKIHAKEMLITTGLAVSYYLCFL